jgi:hypothetical protein
MAVRGVKVVQGSSCFVLGIVGTHMIDHVVHKS